jgi:hypothetical protein
MAWMARNEVRGAGACDLAVEAKPKMTRIAESSFFIEDLPAEPAHLA